MKIKDYIIESERTISKEFNPKHTELLHATGGLMAEAGELFDAVKKAAFYQQDLDVDNVREELGDAMFYIAYTLRLMGFDIEEVLDENHAKLLERYPYGFTKNDSVERKDKQNVSKDKNETMEEWKKAMAYADDDLKEKREEIQRRLEGVNSIWWYV